MADSQKFNWCSHIKQNNNQLLCLVCKEQIQYTPPPQEIPENIPENKKSLVRWRIKLKASIDTIWNFVNKHKSCQLDS